MINKLRVALIQNIIHSHKKETLASVAQNIKDAVDQGSQVVILGECFNSYYQTIHLQNNSEDFSDPNNRETYDFLSELSRKYNLLLFGGSIPEKGKDNKLFNTALCFNNGELIGKYSKTHLFDIDIPGKITYFESKTFSQGNEICVVDTQYGKFGIGICYDVRFPELAQIMRDRGCHFLVYPGAFNQTTGPLHWELLLRARALDNQLFLAGVSAARYRGDDQGIYQAWGHSSLIDPWGRVLVQAQQDPVVLIHDIDLDEVQKIRQQIPVSLQKRVDLYELKSK